MSPVQSTSNALSSQQRSALVRSSRKLARILGDVPRVFEANTPLPVPELTRTISSLTPAVTESVWQKRKPTHLPPLLKLPTPSTDALDPLSSPVYQRSSTRRGSVLSIAPSILSNAPSTASGSSTSDAHTDAARRRTKLERLRRKLGDDVPASAVFPTTPRTAVPGTRTPRTARAAHHTRPRQRSRSRSRSSARLSTQLDDARSVTFTISSDESVHAVALTAARVSHKPKHIYQTGPLPPVPAIPAHLTSASSRVRDDEDGSAGLLRPRQKMAAGSMIGGSDFKAARRAKREGRTPSGMAEPGEVIEMVGFMRL